MGPKQDDVPTVVEGASSETSDLRHDRYVVGDEIARGGMGRVVEATDTLLGRTVAIKQALATDDAMARRFTRETHITARLEHPSIVPLYDAGYADGVPFYVMRRVSGRPLSELIAKASTLDARLALLPHLLAAAQAIAHAHGRKTIHRDIKPSNILVGELGETVVIDWGLAKILDESDEPAHDPVPGASLQTKYGAVIGTLGFMSPEQLHGDAIDERADVYALGATLYFTLSGRLLYREDDPKIVPIREAAPGIPPELVTIIEKALADADARYPTAAALVEDLQRFSTGQLVASHRYSAGQRVWRFVRRNRVAVATVAIAIVAIAVGGTIALQRVFAERAAAVRAQREALDRADELTLDKARVLATSNPTLAVASIKHLADSPLYWREVRDIAAAARSNGVAFGLPASENTTRIEIARDGIHALSTGEDGVVRYYDLAARTSREVARLGAEAAAGFTDDERALLGSSKAGVVRIDLATGATTTLSTGAVDQVAAGPNGSAIWLANGEVWLANAKLAIAAKVQYITTSPDHKWLATCDADNLYIVALSSEPRITTLPMGNCLVYGWAPDSSRLFFADFSNRQELYAEIALADPPQVVARRASIDELPIDRTDPDPISMKVMHHPMAASNGVMITSMGITTELEVRSPYGNLTLAKPSTPLRLAAASPFSHYVLDAAVGELVVWDLDGMFPAVVDEGVRDVDWTGSEQLITATDDTIHWFDLGKGDRFDIAIHRAQLEGGPNPDVVLVGTQTGIRVEHRHGSGYDTPTVNGDTRVIDAKRIVQETARDVSLLVPETGASKKLVEGHGQARLWVEPTSVVAIHEDGTLWHYDVAADRVTIYPKPLPQKVSETTVSADGTAFFIDDKVVHQWRLDGTEQTLAIEPLSLKPIDRDHAIAVMKGIRRELLSFDQTPQATTYPDRHAHFTANAVLDFGATTPFNRRLNVTELLTGIEWRLATSNESLGIPRASFDGKRIASKVGKRAVVWTLDLPSTPQATRVWLDKLTNAVVDHGELVFSPKR